VKSKWIGFWQFGMVLVMLVGVVAPIQAQSTLTIAAPSAIPTFQLDNTGTTATNNLTASTNWNFGVSSGHFFSAQLSICLSMTAPMKGTGTNTDTISQNLVRVNGSSIVTGGTNCGVATAYQVVTVDLSWLGNSPSNRTYNGSRSDTVGISISGYPANLESDTYTGTINLIASVQ
jgi:hypothetical protein